MPQIRISRNGRITIPKEIRNELRLENGTIMNIHNKNGVIVIKPLSPLEPEEPVGEEMQKRLLEELEALRRR